MRDPPLLTLFPLPLPFPFNLLATQSLIESFTFAPLLIRSLSLSRSSGVAWAAIIFAKSGLEVTVGVFDLHLLDGGVVVL